MQYVDFLFRRRVATPCRRKCAQCKRKVAICVKIDGLCIQNDGFCIRNDGFCIQHDDLNTNVKAKLAAHLLADEDLELLPEDVRAQQLQRRAKETGDESSIQMMKFAFKMMNFVSKMTDFVF